MAVSSSSSAALLVVVCLFVASFLTAWAAEDAAVSVAHSIGCFVCSSFNGSEKNCEDTFNSNIIQYDDATVSYYQYPCWGYRKNREGLFPADHCIKISGYRTEDNSQTMVIRTCALDSGTLTADTEIVRISHCGHFKYNDTMYNGCVQSCDTNGCNTGERLIANGAVFFLLSLIITNVCR